MVGDLFGPIFIPERFSEAVSGRAWLSAMLEAEGALAVAQARAGLIPQEAADDIVSCCDAARFDPGRSDAGDVPRAIPSRRSSGP